MILKKEKGRKEGKRKKEKGKGLSEVEERTKKERN
jgi:hypothetical protein